MGVVVNSFILRGRNWSVDGDPINLLVPGPEPDLRYTLEQDCLVTLGQRRVHFRPTLIVRGKVMRQEQERRVTRVSFRYVRR